MTELPPGFKLDGQADPQSLPPGFKIDAPAEPTGFMAGLATTLSGMGRNLGAGMQGTSPSTGDKRLVGEYALTDAGHDVKLPDGQYRRIDPSREVVLSDPVSKRVMVYERDQPVDSIAGRADAAGRLLGIGAMSGAPQGINAATAATKAAGAVDKMRAAKVDMTPGQAAGGILQKLEDKATSMPIVGDFINRARTSGVDSFNVATGNKVLEPLKQTVDKGTKAGRGLISEVGQKIDDAYAALVPKLQLKSDAQLVDDLANIEAGTMMSKDLRKVFTDTINAKVFGRFEGEALNGRHLKDVESELGQLASDYGRSAMAGERELGRALNEAKGALREALTRSNPEQAQALSDINRAYAMLLRMENAGAAAGSKEGVFTPAALRAATKAKDTSRNKRAFARGDALLQDWAEAGESVLGSTMPNSGSADRMLLALAAGGGMGAVEPTSAAITGALTLPYMPYARQGVVGLMGQAPALRRSLPGGTGLMSIGASDPRAVRAGR